MDLIDSLTRWELTHRARRPDRHRRARRRGPPGVQGARRGPRRHRHAAADGGAAEPRRRAGRRRGRSPIVAAWASRLPDLRITPDIAALGRELGVRPGEVAAAYAALDEHSGSTSSASASRRSTPRAAGPRPRSRACCRTSRGSAGPGSAAPCRAAATANPGGGRGLPGPSRDAVADAAAFRRDADADPGAGLDGLTVVLPRCGGPSPGADRRATTIAAVSPGRRLAAGTAAARGHRPRGRRPARR